MGEHIPEHPRRLVVRQRASRVRTSTTEEEAAATEEAAAVTEEAVVASTSVAVATTPPASGRNPNSVAATAYGSDFATVNTGGYVYTPSSVSLAAAPATTVVPAATITSNAGNALGDIASAAAPHSNGGSSSSSSSSSSSAGFKMTTPILIGIIAGGSALVIIIALVTGICCWKKRKAKKEGEWWKLNDPNDPSKGGKKVKGQPVIRLAEKKDSWSSPNPTASNGGYLGSAPSSPFNEKSPADIFGDNYGQPHARGGKAHDETEKEELDDSKSVGAGAGRLDRNGSIASTATGGGGGYGSRGVSEAYSINPNVYGRTSHMHHENDVITFGAGGGRESYQEVPPVPKLPQTALAASAFSTYPASPAIPAASPVPGGNKRQSTFLANPRDTFSSAHFDPEGSRNESHLRPLRNTSQRSAAGANGAVDSKFRDIMTGRVGRDMVISEVPSMYDDPATDNKYADDPAREWLEKAEAEEKRRRKKDTLMDVTDAYMDGDENDPRSSSYSQGAGNARTRGSLFIAPGRNGVPPLPSPSLSPLLPHSQSNTSISPLRENFNDVSPVRADFNDPSSIENYPPSRTGTPAHVMPSLRRLRSDTSTASAAPQPLVPGRVDSKPLRELEDILDSFQHNGRNEPMPNARDSSLTTRSTSTVATNATEGRQRPAVPPLNVRRFPASASGDSLVPPTPSPRDFGQTSVGNGQVERHPVSIYSSAGDIGEYSGAPSEYAPSRSGTLTVPPTRGASIPSSPTPSSEFEERIPSPTSDAQVLSKVSLLQTRQTPVRLKRDESLRDLQQTTQRQAFDAMGLDSTSVVTASPRSTMDSPNSFGHSINTAASSSPATPREAEFQPHQLTGYTGLFTKTPHAGYGGNNRDTMMTDGGFEPLAAMSKDPHAQNYNSTTMDMLSDFTDDRQSRYGGRY